MLCAAVLRNYRHTVSDASRRELWYVRSGPPPGPVPAVLRAWLRRCRGFFALGGIEAQAQLDGAVRGHSVPKSIASVGRRSIAPRQGPTILSSTRQGPADGVRLQ